MPFFPPDYQETLRFANKDLPIFLAGIVVWTIIKIRAWNRHAYQVGLLHLKGEFHVEGFTDLSEVMAYTKNRIQQLNRWHRQWAKKKLMFILLYTTGFFVLIVGCSVVALLWRKGASWFNSISGSSFPIYLLLFGIPLALALFISMEIWRQNANEHMNLVRFQTHNPK